MQWKYLEFNTPDGNKKTLTTFGVVNQYSFDSPKPPTPLYVFSTAENVKRILKDQDAFKVVWGPAIYRLTGGVDYMLAGDAPANTSQHEAVYKSMYTGIPTWIEQIWKFYTETTEKLIHKDAFHMENFIEIDAVKE